MLSSQFTIGKKWNGLKKYMRSGFKTWPRLVNLEVTKFCNAKCDFCACWHEKDHPQLKDFEDVLKKFRPIVLSLTGGEPLLRKDIIDIVKMARPYCSYMAMVTNGQLLTEEKAEALHNAGLDQLSFSLNYLGEKHDVERQIPGLFGHISKLIPKITAKGHDFVAFNTVIMDQNLDQIIPIVFQAREWGAKVSFSCYNSLKTNDRSRMVANENLERLKGIVDELMVLRKRFGHIVTSEFYLKNVLRYFETGVIPNCLAGIRFVQVTPDGYVKRCSEKPVECHFSEYDPKKMGKTSCNICWFSCRGETETPITPKRVWEFVKN